MNGKIGSAIVAALLVWAGIADGITPPFRFDRDTFAFANMTVFQYENGVAHIRRGEDAKQRRYTRRCFVLSRTAMQFRKFARFDPRSAPLDDRELAARIHMVTTRAAWKPALPENQRIVFPGYADLREMSKARGLVLQENVGHGWPTYWRPGNYRMIFVQGVGYQEQTHANLNAALARGDLFIAYLTTLPQSLSINHAILVYARKPSDSTEVDRYVVYDSNHPEKPRELWWSERDRAFGFQKDWDFVGGYVRAYQIYGKPLQ
ncbi:MAG: hypothetical protein QOH24_2181 [Verrucomicrobiota bacterium]|jgi:hypothetical protein